MICGPVSRSFTFILILRPVAAPHRLRAPPGQPAGRGGGGAGVGRRQRGAAATAGRGGRLPQPHSEGPIMYDVRIWEGAPKMQTVVLISCDSVTMTSGRR